MRLILMENHDSQKRRELKLNFALIIRFRCLEFYQVVRAQLALNRACSNMTMKAADTAGVNQKTKRNLAMEHLRYVS